MPDLVCHHVCAREVTGRAKAIGQVLEEGEVEIHLPIARAIERAHRRLAEAARRLRRVTEQYEHRRFVTRTPLAEDLRPHVLGALEHDRDELRLLVVGRDAGGCGFLSGRAAVDDVDGVCSGEGGREKELDGATVAAAERLAHAHPSTVLDVGASSPTLPFHADIRLQDSDQRANQWF